jgi:tRNA(Ile)-lysidine synthase
MIRAVKPIFLGCTFDPMSNKRILLAISGGVDSMVMLHRMLAIHGNKALAVAHCNFNLRGKESDEDEAFVRAACKQLDIPFYCKRFQTTEYSSEKGLSIQEAARELRYQWFFELMRGHDLSALATAHHTDDSIETFFINLMRGSGPRGLSGILEDEKRHIIRPLMDMDRAAIHAYAQEHGITWREDRSNASTAYLRNAIRHDLIPLMEEMRPGFRKVMKRNLAQQKALSSLLDKAIESYRSKSFQEDSGTIRIEIQGLDTDGIILTNILRPYGFTTDQVENILDSSKSGKQVMSTSHIISTYRGGLLLSPLTEAPSGPWLISEDLQTADLPFELELQHIEEPPKTIDPDRHLAYLNVAELAFPLTVRKWKDGDRFRPIGMNGSKLVSDLLNDLKVPLHEKVNTYILLSGNEIAWVIGRRISDVFKCEQGKPALLLRYKP